MTDIYKLKRIWKTIIVIGMIGLCTFSGMGCADCKGEASDINLGVEEISVFQVMEEAIPPSPTPMPTPTPTPDTSFDITLTFAGDVCFADDCDVMKHYIALGEEITKVIDPAIIDKMQNADLTWINNEFCYSEQGSPLPGKAFTFRADPKRVHMLEELGVDLAGLANNHVYDYGMNALLDTLSTLTDAGIPYVGAGYNLEEAMSPYYVEIQGQKIAFVAASRAEKFKMTPQATQEEAGILRCYEPELFLEEIRKAKENADFVIAIVHWGTEYSTVLEEVQLSTGKEYLDAGADAIIGGHSHCLQGFEYYDGKPIAYSLGNFWFNPKTLDSMLVTLRIWGDANSSRMTMQVTPALQAYCETRMVEGETALKLYKRLQDISVNVVIDEEGYVWESVE